MSESYPDWQDEKVKVVKNIHGVCSIWPAERSNAPGWEDAGFSGSKEECLQFVKEHCDGNCRWLDQPPEASDYLPSSGRGPV